MEDLRNIYVSKVLLIGTHFKEENQHGIRITTITLRSKRT